MKLKAWASVILFIHLNERNAFCIRCQLILLQRFSIGNTESILASLDNFLSINTLEIFISEIRAISKLWAPSGPKPPRQKRFCCNGMNSRK